MEDALLSPVGFAILSCAGLLTKEYGPDPSHEVHIHKTTKVQSSDTEIDLTDALEEEEKICATAPIFVMKMQDDDFTGEIVEGLKVDAEGKKLTKDSGIGEGSVFVDYYTIQSSGSIDELQIDAENFAGYYYVEASTLFRRQSDGVDMPAELTFPNVKIQSNFTFTMASTGDPSTFSFTMDAFPGYTYFNPTRKVLCAMQIVKDASAMSTSGFDTVFPHKEGEVIDESTNDSAEGKA